MENYTQFGESDLPSVWREIVKLCATNYKKYNIINKDEQIIFDDICNIFENYSYVDDINIYVKFSSIIKYAENTNLSIRDNQNCDTFYNELADKYLNKNTKITFNHTVI